MQANTQPNTTSNAYALPDWTLDDIPLQGVDVDVVHAREDIFFLVTGASFVEIASELYTDNLIAYFAGDTEVCDWLKHTWQTEETRHGRALRAYARHVWPEFDWERAYRSFFAEYSQSCTVEEFEPTRGLELVARCVVETGTTTYYQALADNAPEPILAGIARLIRADEINHYKHFLQFFRRYRQEEKHTRLQIIGALLRRAHEARNSDAECALRHAMIVRTAGTSPDGDAFQALCQRISHQVRQHYPADMAVKMLLRPLDLPVPMARLAQKPLSALGRRLLLN